MHRSGQMDTAFNTHWFYLANRFTGMVAFFWLCMQFICMHWKLRKIVLEAGKGNTGQTNSLQKITSFNYGKYC